MSYISTRGYSKENLSFLEVVQMGLSPDGGLFVPQEIPTITLEEIENLAELSYGERLFAILNCFELGIEETELFKMIEKAYSSFHQDKRCPLQKTEDNRFILELFHGPTASFKDMALQLTPHFFNASKTDQNQKFCLLTATSGDTGIAAIEGFRRLENTSVFVTYPKDGVSSLQKKQMQSIEADNVKVLGIDGDFDFCQSASKRLFTDTQFRNNIQKKYNTKFAAGNSMNWGRLIPQIGYYFSAYADLRKNEEIEQGEEIEVCVPSGNFGNLLGAFIAKKMGLPIAQFICASNENNILTEFLQTGEYNISTKTLTKTDSPSIDILKSSNIERLLYWQSDENLETITQWFASLETTGSFTIPKETLAKIQKDFSANYCTESEMHATVQSHYKKHKTLLDPHTAVAVCVSEKIPSTRKRIIASTAHYEKFAPSIHRIFNHNSSQQKTSLQSLFAELGEMDSITKKHPNLIEVLEKEAVQTESIDHDYDALLEKVTQFLEKQ